MATVRVGTVEAMTRDARDSRVAMAAEHCFSSTKYREVANKRVDHVPTAVFGWEPHTAPYAVRVRLSHGETLGSSYDGTDGDTTKMMCEDAGVFGHVQTRTRSMLFLPLVVHHCTLRDWIPVCLGCMQLVDERVTTVGCRCSGGSG